jgi:hypothetical protein
MSEQDWQSTEKSIINEKIGTGADSVVYKYTHNPWTSDELIWAFKEFHWYRYEIRGTKILEQYSKLHEILSWTMHHIHLDEPIVIEYGHNWYAISDFTFEFLKLDPQEVTLASSVETKKEIVYADIPYVEWKTLYDLGKNSEKLNWWMCGIDWIISRPINQYFNKILWWNYWNHIVPINIKIKFDPQTCKLHCIVTDTGNNVIDLMQELEQYGTNNKQIAEALNIKYENNIDKQPPSLWWLWID